MLDDLQLAYLWQRLQTPPSDGGLWNSRKVAEWMSEFLGRSVSKQRGWEYLKGFELKLKQPRPAHISSDPFELEKWKKKLNDKYQQLCQNNPNAIVELWSMDEHRLGLKPIQRQIWAEIGENLTADVNWKYQWLWLYGFVAPQSGETYFWILPQVNNQLFLQVLEDFAREFHLGENKQVMLVLDGAGWHISKAITEHLPPGLHLVEFIPAYSPELQPAERLWPIVDEPLVNRSFTDLKELEEILYTRCQVILKQPELVKGITNFSWWPQSGLTTAI